MYSSLSVAQNTYQVGALPSINFNYKLKKDWSFNFKIESRQSLHEGVFNGNKDNSYDYVLTDYSLIAAKKVGLNSRLSGGYLFRVREGKIINRLIQQYTIVQRLAGFRLAHRIVTDQTFSSNQSPEFRLRYRLASEIPLNGEAADTKEYYLKISNEYLNGLESSEYDLEIRLVPMIGYVAGKNHKIETGFDYRINGFIRQNTDHDFWLSINWYIEI